MLVELQLSGSTEDVWTGVAHLSWPLHLLPQHHTRARLGGVMAPADGLSTECCRFSIPPASPQLHLSGTAEGQAGPWSAPAWSCAVITAKAPAPCLTYAMLMYSFL